MKLKINVEWKNSKEPTARGVESAAMGDGLHCGRSSTTLNMSAIKPYMKT
jgi:hypothetical protein